MATQTLIVEAVIQPTTVALRNVSTGATVDTSTTIAAFGATVSLWTAEFTDVPAGSYIVETLDSSGAILSGGEVELTLTTATFRVYQSIGAVSIDAADIRAAVGLAAANLDAQLATIPSAADIRAAVGLAAANLDDQLATIPSAADIRAAVGLAAANLDAQLDAIPTANENADALLDRASAVDGKTPREALRIVSAICAGKVSGAGTGTEVFTGLDGTTTRATVTVDSSGNRTGVTYG